MKMMIMVLTMLFTTASFASFQAFQSTTSLGVMNKIKCSTGMTCTKVGDKLNMTARVLGDVLTAEAAETLVGAECGSTVVNQPFAVSITLPTGSSSLIGCKFKFVMAYSSGVTVDPDGSSIIYSLTNANGDRILNATKGSIVELEYATANTWFASPISGSQGWTDNN